MSDKCRNLSTSQQKNQKMSWIKKFKFTYLLPALIVVMIVYEFSAYGWSIDASVNKAGEGIFYGILLYIAAYVIKVAGAWIWRIFFAKEESPLPS